MASSFKKPSTIPASKTLVIVVWLFVAIIVGLFGLSYLTIDNLSDARAYVGGEGLWSKAQKQAMYDLLRYSISHSEQDYLAYQQSLLVPLGDKEARIELEKPAPDMSVVRRGFLQGRNHPDDVRGMADFFRRFRHVKSMSEAIAIWTEGDSYIEQLQRLGESLHSEIVSGKPDLDRIADIARQVDVVGARLTPLEDRFSYTLGVGARETRRSFLVVTFGASALSLLAGAMFTFVTLRHFRQVDERYKHLIDTANDAIFVIDAESGIVVGANRLAADLLGLPLQEIVGMSGEESVAESNRDAYKNMIQAALEGKAVAGMELRLNHSAGHTVAVEVNASLTTFGGRRIIQGIFRDIRDRRRLEEEVRQAQKMEVVGRLAGGIAHDFNNLLMVILTQLSKVQSATTAPEARQHADTVRTAAERAASLTKELLAFGRKQVLVLEVVDLNDLLKEMKPMLITLPDENVQFRFALSSQTLPVKVDPGKIEQVVMNLALNACDAMPSGGSLEIKTSNESSAKVSRLKEEHKRDGFALIEMKDTGVGMSPETRAHLFEPFFTTKPVGKGTGLGLSTAYGIVKQSGGFIDVESAAGVGTTFRVYLPIAEEPLSLGKPAVQSKQVAGGNEVVLLAEDQPSIRSVLREYLELKGYKILEAGDGIEAVEIADRRPDRIDVLVTDVIMPHMRGLEVATRVAERHPGVCVVFMSGYSEETLVENQLLSTGNFTLIQKPFEPEQLAWTIREVLDRR